MAEPALVFFFFALFPAGCPGLISGFFSFSFFFPPFSGGLPRVNTRLFLFFPHPYSAGCPCMFSLGIFQRIFVTIFIFILKKGCFAPLCVPLGLKKPGDFTVSKGHGHPLVLLNWFPWQNSHLKLWMICDGFHP
jgi:hypothetical protein